MYAMTSAFVLYFICLISIGFYFYNKSKTAKSFMLGDRSVNYFVTAIATQASDMGGWLFLGFPAAIYVNGLFELWTIVGLVGFTFLNWHYIAPRLRKISEKTNSLTLTSLFENQFGFSSTAFRLTNALILLIFFTFYIAAGLVTLGRLFEGAFGIEYHLGIIIALLGGIIYTLIGGFLAIAWSDLFQGLFLLFVVVTVPLYAFYQNGSMSDIITIAKNNDISLSMLSSPRDMLDAVLLAAGWGLGYCGQPHLLTNYMGIKDVKNMRFAKYVGLTWQLIVLLFGAAIGLIGLSYFQYPVANPEMIFIDMALSLFVPFVAGLALCAIIAATLSSMDSQILIAGSIISEDLFKKQLNYKKRAVFVSRMSSIFISLLALGIAWYGTASVYFLINYPWSGIGSAFGPLVITCLYGKRISSSAAIAGMVSGALISGLWPLFNTSILPLIPGFFGSLCAIHVINVLTKE